MGQLEEDQILIEGKGRLHGVVRVLTLASHYSNWTGRRKKRLKKGERRDFEGERRKGRESSHICRDDEKGRNMQYLLAAAQSSAVC